MIKIAHHQGLAAALVLLAGLACPIRGLAQQPTATIVSFAGDVRVAARGSALTAAAERIVLEAGDTLETGPDAQVVLMFSEGSELRLGQNTKVDLAELLQTPVTGARTSRIKLLYGQLRAFLSPGHQKDGSTFTMETPNAVAGVKFSQPDVEMIYEPESQTTILRAYTVEMSIVNLLTKAEVKAMPKGHQAIIREDFILITKIMEIGGLLEQLRRTANFETELLNLTAPPESPKSQEEAHVNQLLTTLGVVGSNTPATSHLPEPGIRPGSPGPEPVGYSFNLTVQ